MAMVAWSRMAMVAEGGITAFWKRMEAIWKRVDTFGHDIWKTDGSVWHFFIKRDDGNTHPKVNHKRNNEPEAKPEPKKDKAPVEFLRYWRRMCSML